MKMAKAQKEDMQMAMDLCHALEAISHAHYATMPSEIQVFGDDEDEDPERFDIEDADQCKRVVAHLIEIMRRGSLMRVVYGMSVLLDPKNKVVDPDADILEHHPDVIAALAARDDALKAGVPQ